MAVQDGNGQSCAVSGASDVGPFNGEGPETFTMEDKVLERGGKEKSKECPK